MDTEDKRCADHMVAKMIEGDHPCRLQARFYSSQNRQGKLSDEQYVLKVTQLYMKTA